MSKETKKHVKKEERTQDQIMNEINRHLEEDLQIPHCLEGVNRIIPTGTDSEKLKELGIELHKIDKGEALQMEQFCKSVDVLDSSVMILKNIETGAFKLIQPKKSSRYFKQGRKKIRNRVLQRIGRENVMNGMMITLTYDPKIVERWEAWDKVGEHISKFFDWANKIRKRRMGSKKALRYFWVIEEQGGTGYPHVHIFFPNLKWFMEWDWVMNQWGRYGSAKYTDYQSVNIARYIMKYIGKMKGYSILALSYLWANKRRLYSFSRSIAENTGAGSVKEKRYELWGVYNKKKGYGEWDEKEGRFVWLGNVPIHEVMQLTDGIEDDSGAIFEYLCEGLIYDASMVPTGCGATIATPGYQMAM